MTKHLLRFCIGVTLILGGCVQTPVLPPATAVVPPGSFARSWKADLKLDGDKLESLYVRDTLLLAYTSKNHVWVLDRNGGQIVRLDLPVDAEGKIGPPALVNDYIIYPTWTTLEIYNRLSNVHRSVPLGYHIHSPMVVGRGSMVYLGIDTANGARIAEVDVDAKYGNTLWEKMSFGGVSGAPALYDNTIYFGDEKGRVYAVGNDGKPAWLQLDFSSYTTTGPIKSAVQADDFGVYAASTDGVLYCIDRITGKTKWRFFSNRSLDTTPAVTKNFVYQYVPDQGLVCIDKLQGKLAREPHWVIADGRQLLSEDATYAYISLADGSIAAIEKATGKKAFESKTSGYDLFVTNTAADALIYVANADGHLLAIKPVVTVGVSGQMVMELRPVETVAMAR